VSSARREEERATLMMLINDRSLPIPRKKTFSDFGIWAGVKLKAKYRDPGLYPKKFCGVVEQIYDKFAIVQTKGGYRTTIHITDLICGFAYVAVGLNSGEYEEFDTALAAVNQ
jgi:hypothetical protein